MPRNIRFWEFVNGSWVKLTLAPGQTLHHATGGPTDEGYSFECRAYNYDSSAVTREITCEARDCDGRLDRFYEQTLERIEVIAADPSMLDHPAGPRAVWADGQSSQRDYSAESAGY